MSLFLSQRLKWMMQSEIRTMSMACEQYGGVACVPGEAFYHDGSGKKLGRFCFAKKDAQLDEACRRIERL